MEQVLETIVAKSRNELAESRKRIPASLLESRIPELPPVRDFAAALRRPGRRVVAELKAASPSKGAIRPELDREVERLAAGLEIVEKRRAVGVHRNSVVVPPVRD